MTTQPITRIGIYPFARPLPLPNSGSEFAVPFPADMLDLMSEVTRILGAIEQGELHAAEQLLPLVYEELRKLASQKLAQEKPGQTLQATALVHEAYLRLVGPTQPRVYRDRHHFFAAAASAMRRILIDQARRKQTEKHGGGRPRQELPDVTAPQADDELLA